MDESHVLCYGHDGLLAATRVSLLQAVGCSVSAVDGEEAFRLAVCRLAPEVIVLCQSLKSNECLQAAEYAHVISASSNVLVMENQRAKCSIGGDHVSLPSGGGPAAFIRTVREMMLASERAQSTDMKHP